MFHTLPHKLPANTPHPGGQTRNSAMPDVGQLMAFEAGLLNEDETIALFQHGVDHGWVWQLQGSYGRFAQGLINDGLVTRPTQDTLAAS